VPIFVEKMHDIQTDMKKYYEEWWENPSDPRNVIFKKLNRELLGRFPQGEGKRALDVGSGKGTIVSFLRSKGYRVTAVELNENFTNGLKKDFPELEVIGGDFNTVPIHGAFDVVTAIEFIQNLDREALYTFLQKVAALTDSLFINISNRSSLHGFWTTFRGFQKPFVYTYTPEEIEGMLEKIGFRVTYRRGIGFLTPITLLANFRLTVIPAWIAKTVNTIGDRIFPRLCHLYYLEAKRNNGRTYESRSNRR
jgi:SAM-dependent methyltransferase